MNINRLHDLTLFIIPIICIFQAYSGITAGPLDIVFLLIITALCRRFASGSLVIDRLGILLFMIILFAMLTMFTFRITQTSWINVFRSNLFTFAIYLYAINYREKININVLKYPFLAINLFNIWVLLNTWAQGFIHHSLESSYFNLNNIGIISLLVLIMTIVLQLRTKKLDLISLAGVIISTSLVILSFSRANYLMLSMVAIFLALFVFNFKKNIKFFVFVGIALLTFLSQDIGTNILNYGFAFLDQKVNVGTPAEIFLGRFNNIAIKPIEHYMLNKGPVFILLGGSLVPEHSLLITHITCFGLFSMILYLFATINTVKGIINISNSIKLVSLMMLLLFINDSSTNASTYIAFVKLMPFAFLGLIRGETNEKYLRLKW